MALVTLGLIGPRFFEEQRGSGEEVGAQIRLAHELHKHVLLKHSALRLTAEAAIAQSAREVVSQAEDRILDFEEYADTFPDGVPGPAWSRFDEGMHRLRDEVEELVEKVRRSIAEEQPQF